MTYCVALKLERGLVFAADTRTNAGIDNISTFSKLHSWEQDGERVMVLLSAGNLAITQAIISQLEQHQRSDNLDSATIFNVQSMFQAARVVGDAVRQVYAIDGKALEARGESFTASLIFGGQIKGESPRLFHIYAEGNFIEATDDTAFFQIGEHKYGKPILDRVARADMRLGEAAKLLLVSFDSTLRSNLSVGMPVDLLAYQADNLRITRKKRIEQDDEYFKDLSDGWSVALREAFDNLPELEI